MKKQINIVPTDSLQLKQQQAIDIVLQVRGRSNAENWGEQP